MLVRIEIKSVYNGAIIAHKITPFLPGMVREEMANIRNYCRHNALESAIVTLNNHVFTLNF